MTRDLRLKDVGAGIDDLTEWQSTDMIEIASAQDYDMLFHDPVTGRLQADSLVNIIAAIRNAASTMPVSRAATTTVAPVDATDAEKASADIVLADGSLSSSTNASKINAAIAAFGSNGGHLKFLSGNVYFEDSLDMYANSSGGIRVSGQGGSTVFWACNSLNKALIKCSGTDVYNCMLDSFRMDCNKSNQSSGDGINITGMRGLIVRDITVANAYRHSLYADGYTANSNGLILDNFRSQTPGTNAIYLSSVYAFKILGGYLLTSGAVGATISGGEGIILGTIFDQNTGRGLYLYNCKGVLVIIPYCGYNGTWGAEIGGNSERCKIKGSLFVGNGQESGSCAGIRVNTTGLYNSLLGNTCWDDQGTKTQDYGIDILNGSTYTIVMNNDVNGNKTKGIRNNGGSTNIIRNNPGYVTEKSGTSTGTGSEQTIPHGLGFTPTASQIMLWNIDDGANPYHSSAPDATNIYITAVNIKDYGWATVPDASG